MVKYDRANNVNYLEAKVLALFEKEVTEQRIYNELLATQWRINKVFLHVKTCMYRIAPDHI